MKQLILQDERSMSADIIKIHYRGNSFRKEMKPFDRAYFLGDGNLILDYCFPAVADNNRGWPIFSKVSYLPAPQETREWAEGYAIGSMEEALADKKPAAWFFFADCIGGLAQKDQTLAQLDAMLASLKAHKKSRAVLTVLLPKIPAYSEEITALAEREFNFYLEEKMEKTPEVTYYMELEARCRAAVREGANLSMLRYSNVFSPDRAHTPEMDFAALARDCFEKKCVEITDADRKDVFSVSYVRGACFDILLAMGRTRKGHIYNADGMALSMEDIKRMIAASSDTFALKAEFKGGAPKRSYRVLSALKLRKSNIPPQETVAAGIAHVVSYETGLDFDTSENVEFYCGKIKGIQALEVEILKEIDRICQKYGIKYFLAGGTLLGAVRQGCSIPWDDDLDIGMLRDDFEKFKKIAKKELRPGFSYSGPKEGSHYTIDKIRLDDSYFSTNFSGKNVYPDGIFVDLLIYDRTSNHRLFQRLHAIVLTALTTLMLIKWYNTPRKNFHHTFSILFLPLLRIIPWGFWHGLFNFCAKFYRRKKNARWLIDSVGKKVYADPLPNEGLDETVYVDFEGIKAPIPVDPKPYLNYAYGPNYMNLPPFSQRRCPHNFARIDLGKKVFDIAEETPFRTVDIRGELFEEEK